MLKTRIAALLSLALCVLSPAATHSVQIDSSGSVPRQAIVFDGSLNRDSTFGVAFTSDGIVGQVSSPLLTCGGEDSPPSDNAAMPLSPQRAGVFTSVTEPVVDAALDPAHSWPDVTASPRLRDDCEATGYGGLISAYLDASIPQAEQLNRDVERCAAELQRDACRLADLIQRIPTQDELLGRPGVGLVARESEGSVLWVSCGGVCQRCAIALRNVPRFLNQLHRARANCIRDRQLLSELIARHMLISERGERLSRDEKLCVLQLATELRSAAGDLTNTAERLRAAIDSAGESCEAATVDASCRSCSGSEWSDVSAGNVIIERG